MTPTQPKAYQTQGDSPRARGEEKSNTLNKSSLEIESRIGRIASNPLQIEQKELMPLFERARRYRMCNTSSFNEQIFRRSCDALSRLCLDKGHPLGKDALRFSEKAYASDQKKGVALSGKILYLISEKDSFPLCEKTINDRFSRSIKTMQERIQQNISFHHFFNESMKEKAFDLLTAKALAKILLPRNALFNAALIPSLLEELEKNSFFRSHDKRVKEILCELASSLELQELLLSIKAPKTQGGESTLLILITTETAQKTASSDLEAKRCALSALLSHKRQGRSGLCFASFLAIELLELDPYFVLSDLKELIFSGFLTKKGVRYPVKLYTSEDEAPCIDLIKDKEAIEKDPAFLAVFSVLDLNPAEPYLSEIAIRHKDKKLSLNAFFTSLAALAKQKYPLIGMSYTELRNLCKFTFECSKVHALLQVYENCLAQMAVSCSSSFINTKLRDAILFALERKCTGVCREQLFETFERRLKERVHLVYDPSVVHRQEADDEMSSQGAFVLFDKLGSNHPSKWIRIDHPTMFQDFIRDLLKECQSEMNCSLSKLIDYVQEAEFVNQAIRKCGYTSLKNPALESEKVDLTPWMFKCGASYKKLLETYFDMKAPPSFEEIAPRDALDLLLKLISYLKAKKKILKELPTIMPCSISSLHVFSLLPKHKTLYPLVQATNEELAKSVIKMKEEGQKISSSPLPIETKQVILDCFLEKYKEVLPQDAKEASPLFLPSSLREFFEGIKDTYQERFKEEKRALLLLEINNLFLKHLPPPIKERLEQTAVHIADTNWAKGALNVHFALFYNPLSNRFEMGKILETGKGLRALHQEKWVTEVSFELT